VIFYTTPVFSALLKFCLDLCRENRHVPGLQSSTNGLWKPRSFGHSACD